MKYVFVRSAEGTDEMIVFTLTNRCIPVQVLSVLEKLIMFVVC